MDLRAWKELEVKPISLHAGILQGTDGSPEGSLGTTRRHQYQHMDEYETEAGSPSKGSGAGPMPVPQPEDDWVEELPRPITHNVVNNLIDAKERFKRSSKTKARKGV